MIFAEGQIDSSYEQHRYEFADFDGVLVNGKFRIRIIKTENWDIRLFSTRQDRNKVRLRNRGGLFEISMEEGGTSASLPPVVVITMPDLRKIDISGEVQMEAGGFSSTSDLQVSMGPGTYLNLNGFEASEVLFNMDGPCTLHAFLNADTIKMNGDGKTTVRMGGRAQNLELRSSGRSRMDGSLLLVDNVDLDLQGLCEIRIAPDNTLTIRSTDEAVIYYRDGYLDEPPRLEGHAILRKY